MNHSYWAWPGLAWQLAMLVVCSNIESKSELGPACRPPPGPRYWWLQQTLCSCSASDAWLSAATCRISSAEKKTFDLKYSLKFDQTGQCCHSECPQLSSASRVTLNFVPNTFISQQRTELNKESLATFIAAIRVTLTTQNQSDCEPSVETV